MPSREFPAPEVQTLMSGLLLGESPRWRDSRLWFSDWGAQEVIAVDLEGRSEVIVRVPSFARRVADGVAFPNGMVVMPDNSTLIVAESYGRVSRPPSRTTTSQAQFPCLAL